VIESTANGHPRSSSPSNGVEAAAARADGSGTDTLERDRGRAAEARLAAIVASSVDAVTGTTIEGIVTDWNPSAERIFGYTAQEIIGRSIAIIAAPERPDEIRANLARIAQGEHIAHQETVRRRKDGVLIDVVLSVSPIRDESGEIIGTATIARDDTELHAATRRHAVDADRAAWFDALTGLPNRASFVRKLGEHIRASAALDSTFAIIYADLDRFREINDTFGHDGGDAVLRELGWRIARYGSDLLERIAHLQVDKFAFLLPPGSDVAAATRAAQDGIEFLREPFRVSDQPVQLSASMGIAVYPTDGRTAEELLRHAETAMFAAKRNETRYVVYSAALDAHTEHKIALLHDLRRALETNELSIHYQPQIDFGTGRLVGAEALMRWRHPTRGLIPPLEFIGVAEETGLILELTPWVLKRALEQQRLWTRAGLELRMSVNVSMRNLRDPEFLTVVEALVKTSGVDPGSMTLEITEGAMMLEASRTLEALRAIRALGVDISIDDFGTGYSSLSYLSRLPVTEVKIDRAFVMDITEPGPRAIVQAVIDLGKAFGLRVVAEGVKDEATWSQLRALGCDVAQGFYFSEPRTAEDFATWAAEHPSVRGEVRAGLDAAHALNPGPSLAQTRPTPRRPLTLNAPQFALAETVRDGIVVFDQHGRFVQANSAARAISGWSVGDEYAKLFEHPAGLVEIRSAKWVELRHLTLRWRADAVSAVVFSDVTAQLALREAQRTLREVGLIDPLTGLHVESVLRDHLSRSLVLATRDERWVGVVWLALDRFMLTRPEGQRVADEVLRQCAQRVKGAIRESDLAAVFDENTFVIALTAMQAPFDASSVAARVLLALGPPVLVDGRERSVRVTSGVITASDRSISVEELLVRARIAALDAADAEEPLRIDRAP
jgi:PAS domain S-box-containing protein/diguanylate cyclase (GGDEF)-like protein